MKTAPKQKSPAKKPAKSAAKPASTSAAKPASKSAAKPVAKSAAKPATPSKAATSAKARPAASAAAKPSKAAPAPAAKKLAHSVKAPATVKASPKTVEPVPKAAGGKSAAQKPLVLAPSVLQQQAAAKAASGAAPAAPAAPAESGGKGSKKPKPPAKTMSVPAPMTEILVKRQLPDVRRIASAALLSEQARGIASHGQPAKPKEPERSDEPPVDATLIASSLASDVHPKIEDNYDYSVLDDLSSSTYCPAPTRMVNTGCAGGEAAVYFAKRRFSVVGIDSDRVAVGLARERAWLGGVEIDFMVGDQFETPNLLPAESFGLCIDRGAFYKLTDDRDRQRYLANIRRLLFQGGLAYISAGFFQLPEGHEKPKSKKGPPKVLLVREGGVVVNEVRQAGFEVAHRVLRPTADSGEYGELFLYLRK